MSEENLTCDFCSSVRHNHNSWRNHVRQCSSNPNRQISSIEKFNASGQDYLRLNQYTKAREEGREYVLSDDVRSRISLSQKGRKLSSEHRAAISAGMKLAHKEDRAWNIGMSRWWNEPSYPERFFEDVILSEFEDKDYEREYALGRYSLDFAWPKKKRCIEIDGSQHQRFADQVQRDILKDKLIADTGWSVLRVPWKLMRNDPKAWIARCKEFIHS